MAFRNIIVTKTISKNLRETPRDLASRMLLRNSLIEITTNLLSIKKKQNRE